MAGDKVKIGAQMKEFLTMGLKIFQDKDIKAYDDLVDEKDRLVGELATKTQEYDAKFEEVSQLQKDADDRVEKAETAANERAEKAETAANERATIAETKSAGLVEEFQKKFKLWDAAKSKEADLESQIMTLKQELAGENTKVQKAEARISELQGKLSNSEKAFKEMESDLALLRKEHSSRVLELKGTRGELQDCQSQIKQRSYELGLQNPVVNELADSFRKLSDKVHNLAKNFFCTKLPQETPAEELWKELETSGFWKLAPRKTPLSNSMAAQCLRMATAERIIADRLYTDIFRQYYLPHSTPARELIDDITKRLHKKNSYKEAVFRLQLLAAYELDEEIFIASLIKITTGEVIKILDPLLCASGVREDFHCALMKLFEEAVSLWRVVQRSSSKAWVTNDPDSSHYNNTQDDWEQNEEYDTAVGLTSEQMSLKPDEEEPLIPLFPQVSMGGVVVCSGCALWSDQNAVVAASIEFSQTSARSTLQGRMLRRDDRRRLSSGAQWRVDDISKPPLSPSAGYHSFPLRAESRPGSRRPSPPIRKATPPASPPASPPALKPVEAAAG
ncbi:hypothetical protein BDZ45DRAFT_679085, partial [Acephala macrosclerotiorum]